MLRMLILVRFSDYLQVELHIYFLFSRARILEPVLARPPNVFNAIKINLVFIYTCAFV